MASFCERLPPELWLHILSYLSIPDIHTFQRVFKLFNTLICLNESLIYKAAAIHHGFAPAAVPDIQTVTTARKRRFNWLDGVKTWLHYCAFASLNVFHLFIRAPRQATYERSKKLVSKRPYCPLCGLWFRCSSAPNQDRRRGGHYDRNSRAGYALGKLHHVGTNAIYINASYIDFQPAWNRPLDLCELYFPTLFLHD